MNTIARLCLAFFHNSEFRIQNSILLPIITLACAVARADMVILIDGTTLSGSFHKNGDHWVMTDAAGHETEIPLDQVQSVKMGGAPRPDSDTETPEVRLASLRHLTDGYSDLHLIIDRYNKFIAANTGDIAEQARADLATWQQRLDQGCVKVGARWLSPDERDQLGAVEAESAARIGDMLRQNRLQDAADLLKLALTDNPQNPSALYLNGILFSRLNKIADAKTAFEQSNRIVPHRAPTLNNLAVILWKQHVYPAAMLNYTQAMTADPDNKLILDNLTEAFHALPPENRDNLPVQKAAALYDMQEKELEQSQLAAGYVRWGATWVRTEQLTELQKEEAADQAQVADMRAKIESAEASIASADSQINADEQLMRAVNSQQQTITAGGVTQTLPVNLPQQYYYWANDAQFFAKARQTSVDKLNELKEHAGHIHSHLAVPKFTGVQQLFGPEGTPIRTESLSTQPS